MVWLIYYSQHVLIKKLYVSEIEPKTIDFHCIGNIFLDIVATSLLGQYKAAVSSSREIDQILSKPAHCMIAQDEGTMCYMFWLQLATIATYVLAQQNTHHSACKS